MVQSLTAMLALKTLRFQLPPTRCVGIIKKLEGLQHLDHMVMILRHTYVPRLTAPIIRSAPTLRSLHLPAMLMGSLLQDFSRSTSRSLDFPHLESLHLEPTHFGRPPVTFTEKASLYTPNLLELSARLPDENILAILPSLIFFAFRTSGLSEVAHLTKLRYHISHCGMFQHASIQATNRLLLSFKTLQHLYLAVEGLQNSFGQMAFDPLLDGVLHHERLEVLCLVNSRKASRSWTPYSGLGHATPASLITVLQNLPFLHELEIPCLVSIPPFTLFAIYQTS